ncbi:hypothetical protein [Streptomyces sp. A0958]|uniref:hypothetical protein n=1 Tax=Streptomyces sp. A0958 TaxID=2563101 RepID=UPI001F100573|nr:hypothetical protein [Streptomyces sp. A0958]
MIAELQQAVANYAHAPDELDVPELEASLTEDTTWSRLSGADEEHRREQPDGLDRDTFGLRRTVGGWRIAELTLTLDNAF